MSRLSAIVALSTLMLLSACQKPVTYAPQLSKEELAAEEAHQQQIVDEAAKKGGAPRPWRKRTGVTKQFERVADKIDKAGAEMCQEMGLPEQGKRCYYYFRLAQDTDLNAHADGENVVMYSGIMHFLEDDDEVAIIMGHELAHNMMGHIDARKDNLVAGALIGAVIDAAAASQGIYSGGDWTRTGAEMGAYSYSVEFEQEADYVGMYIAARAGYDISKAPDVWRRMSVENPKNLFRDTTHPSKPKRAATLQKTIDEIEYKHKHKVAMLPDIKTQAE